MLESLFSLYILIYLPLAFLGLSKDVKVGAYALRMLGLTLMSGGILAYAFYEINNAPPEHTMSGIVLAVAVAFFIASLILSAIFTLIKVSLAKRLEKQDQNQGEEDLD